GEWGLNMRLADADGFLMAMTIGALPQDKYGLVYDMGVNIGKQCKSLGININFAPDADININADNPVINMRSFGENKYKVAELAMQYFSGMQSQGVMGVVKHFPGHGDTYVDSHKATPVIKHDKKFIDTLDSYPFAYAIDKGVWGVMMGHLSVDALTKDTMVPASVNKDIIQGYLIDRLGFEGLVFTDAMNMKGLTLKYGHGQAEVMAILAGVDVILMPDNIDTAICAVMQAVSEGKIPHKLIKEKCRKILNWKYDMGLITETPSYSVPPQELRIQADSLNKAISQSAVVSVYKTDTAIQTDRNTDTAYFIAIGNTSYDTLLQYVGKHRSVVLHRLTSDMKPKTSDSILNMLSGKKNVYTLVSGGRFAKSTSYYGVADRTFNFLQSINTKIDKDNNTLVLFTNAYFLKYIDSSYNFKDILVAYENNPYMQRAVASVLNGEIKPVGSLSVTARKEHVAVEKEPTPVQDSIDAALTAMGVRIDVLKQLDSIANEGIKQKAYPGCQVLIAKDGNIIMDKSFGYCTYDSLKEVNANTIYDIASLTKVMATTLAVMKLYEQGKIDLDGQIRKYVPEYKHCKFGRLTVKELLSHYSTLPATYPFWTKTLQDGKLSNDLYDYNVRMDENYVPVTDSLFIKKQFVKEMKQMLKDVKLKDQQYTYSDLNFLLLQYMVESISQKSLDAFMNEEFYAKMHLVNTSFNPLDNGFDKSDIAPEENDTVFRRQLIHGTVHDPMASLCGGVCGNAGLFSNAEDLYKICQMLLNKGELNGVRYLQSSTVDAFNRRYFKDKNIRRALGFDKPFISSPSAHCSKYASQLSYGHSGFTGTYLWIEPANNTVFIFLSNRVYPNASPNRLAQMNIRTDINDLIYKLFK
ncbi:MAG: serine hydrolase, partial [Bacteroidales bacterium]|nr:serine hydrolase [Bacteroidales bacterium]